MKKIDKFVKNEAILCIAGLLAVISALIVPPTEKYIDYIDFRVLGLLLCLMLVVSGFQSMGFFESIIEKLLDHISTTRKLVFVLVLMCFFTSMLITNDVALITFVPFAIMVLHKIRKEKLMIIVIVMQTVAANLGSMFTPLGNPQNLYLYSVSHMGILEFLKLMFPITLLSFGLIIGVLFFITDEEIEGNWKIGKIRVSKVQELVFGLLFVVCLLTVLHIIAYTITLAIVIITVFVFNKKLLLRADYMLLLTFVAFFVFVGNMKNIPCVESMLANIVSGNEIIVSVAASQVISNVPAAILLSGFTSDYSGLILGSNIGGLGTLIASMASLISYKFYCRTENARKGRYLAIFTGINVIFLLLILAARLFVL